MKTGMEVIRKYYALVDAGDYDNLFPLFSKDVHYKRGSNIEINGLTELQRFYLSDRSIHSGTHSILEIDATPPHINVSGHFSGELKSGEHVEVDFFDTFRLQDGRIIERVTRFPLGNREI